MTFLSLGLTALFIALQTFTASSATQEHQGIGGYKHIYPYEKFCVTLSSANAKNNHAPVITMFYSLACHHCADFFEKEYPGIEKDYIKTGKIALKLCEFPLDNYQTMAATRLCWCKGTSQYIKRVMWFFKNRHHWLDEKGYLTYFLDESRKISPDKLPINHKEAEDCLSESDFGSYKKMMEEYMLSASKKYKLTGVPAVIGPNGESIGANLTPQMIDDIIDHHQKGKKS